MKRTLAYFVIGLIFSTPWVCAEDPSSESVTMLASGGPTHTAASDVGTTDGGYFMRGLVFIDAAEGGQVWITVETFDAVRLFMFQLDSDWPYKTELSIPSSRVFVKNGHGVDVFDQKNKTRFVFSVSDSFLAERSSRGSKSDSLVHPIRAYGFIEYFDFDGGSQPIKPKAPNCRAGGFPCDAGGPESNSCSIGGCSGIPHSCSVSGCDGEYSACCGCAYSPEGQACCLCVPA